MTFEEAMKSGNVKVAMEMTNTKNQDLVKWMQNVFPRFDKTLLSKVKSPDLYGVVLHPLGFQMMKAFEDGKARDQHKLKRRISARVSEDDYFLLLHYISVEGYDTVQYWLSEQVHLYIDKKRAVYGND